MNQPRAGLNWGFIRRTVERVAPIGLIFWFFVLSGHRLAEKLAKPIDFGSDARLYFRAAQAWLDGGDPWLVHMGRVYFAGPPPTLLGFGPLVPLGEDVAVLIWLVVPLLATVFLVRRLRLPIWWVAFPPFVDANVVGNPEIVMVALLLTGASVLAPILKIYAVVPMALLGKWRELIGAGLILVATLPVLPWGTFVRDLPTIQHSLVVQERYISAFPEPLLMVAVTLSLLLLGRHRAAFAAVPGLWPGSQLHYAGMAAIARPPIVVAALLSVEARHWAALAVIGWGAWKIIERRVDPHTVSAGSGSDDGRTALSMGRRVLP